MDFLFWFILLVPFFQPTYERRVVAAVFAISVGSMEFIDPYLGDYECYLVAGVFDAAVVLVLSLRTYTNMAFLLMVVSIVSLVCNAYGFWLYHVGSAPLIYDNLLVAIYLTAVFILCGGPDAWRKGKVLERIDWVPAVDYMGSDSHQRISKEEEK